MCETAAVSDGFDLTHTGEHQFQFLDVVTSSISPDDTTPHTVTGAAHYYASLPPPPMYVIIDQSGGIYPALTSATVGAGTALSTSGYVAPVAPLVTPQMQSAGVVLPPGVIPAAPTLLRPGLMQQPQPASVIMPAPTAMLPPTSIIPSHGNVRPLPHGVTEMPVPAVSELALNASAGYSGQPLIAGSNTGYSGPRLIVGANRFDDVPFSSMPVDMHIGTRLPEHEVHAGNSSCNVNNSAAKEAVPPHSDTQCPISDHPAAESLDRDDQADHSTAQQEHPPLDAVVAEIGNGLATYEEYSGAGGGAALCEAVTVSTSHLEVVSVNGELSVDASHDVGSLSDTSSVTSPGSLVADVTLNDNASERDVGVATSTQDDSRSPVINASSQQSSASPATVLSPSAAVKTKAPSWASLLKDTTSATNAIVINMNDSHAAAVQQKSDVKAAAKEPLTAQSAVSHVSNDEKLKLSISGLYAAVASLIHKANNRYLPC